MTTEHRQRVNALENIIGTAGRAKDQFQRGDKQMCIAHLRRLIQQSTHMIEELSK